MLIWGGENSRNYSADTASEIDQEVLRIIQDAHEKAKQIISKHIEIMHQAASFLMEKETITGDEFMKIVHKYENE